MTRWFWIVLVFVDLVSQACKTADSDDETLALLRKSCPVGNQRLILARQLGTRIHSGIRLGNPRANRRSLAGLERIFQFRISQLVRFDACGDHDYHPDSANTIYDGVFLAYDLPAHEVVSSRHCRTPYATAFGEYHKLDEGS
jgi:hypothetical protein